MIGTTVSHYRILKELGRGGMGIVYEAEDTLLGRRAALKFMPELVADEAHSLARFQREARAASALNHPNICTIYEIGEDASRWFIAMELLEGQSLDHVLAEELVGLDKLLDWGIQVSDALDAAHSKGIVHRDLKPSNIFLTNRGQLKVLDFGLAKMSDPLEVAGDSPTVSSGGLGGVTPSRLTSPGLAIGTVAFMSPEQARGDELDARSDLFSFGTVLYQMATGRLPFEGKTSAVVFDAIMNREPAPVGDLNPALPPELQRAIDKCLEKDPDLRYQHASELRADLKRIKRDSSGSARGKSGTGTENAAADSAAARSRATISDGARRSASEGSAGRGAGARTTAKNSAAAGFSAENARAFESSQVVAAAKQHRVGLALGSVVVLAVLAAAGFGIFELVHHPQRVPFQNMAIERITSSGDTWAAAMSPDGKYLATLRRGSDGRDSLWMRHLATNSNAQIIPPGDASILDVTFSLDGNYVYFRTRQSSLVSELERVAVLGGTPAKVVRDIDSAPAFSAAAGRFCFMRYDPPKNKQWIISVNLDGSDERKIYDGTGLQTLRNPAWSPDGKHIVLSDRTIQPGSRLSMLDVATGVIAPFYRLPKNTYDPLFAEWMPDGRGLLVGYRVIDIGTFQLAMVSYPQAKFTPITNDLNSYDRSTLSADGKTISTVLRAQQFSLDVFAAAAWEQKDAAVTSLGSEYWVGWINNDQIVVVGDDNQSIKLISLSGDERKTIFAPGDMRIYDMTPCGPKSVVFVGSPTANLSETNIYQLGLEGGTPRRVTEEKNVQGQGCTPDGKWLIYFSFGDGAIRKKELAGGASQVVVAGDRGPSNRFSITPDGKELVTLLQKSEAGVDHLEFVFIALDSGEITRRLPAPDDAIAAEISPDGKEIAFLRQERGVTNVWTQAVSGGSPVRLTNFHLSGATSQVAWPLRWSPDGKRFATVRTLSQGDAVILQEQGK